jgi:PAS domain S-box-containing protein
MDASAGRNGFFYGVGKTTGISGLFIAAPVRRDGSVVGVVAVKVSLREIEAAWDHSSAPIVLSDARGIIFLSSVATWMYHATKPLSAEDLDWVRRHEQYGDRKEFPPVPWSVDRTDTRDGPWVETEIEGRRRRFLAVDGPLPQLGWTLTVMADQAGVTRTRNLSAVLGTLAAGVLLLGTLAWQSRERRLAEQRHARIGLEQRVRERTCELHEAHAFRKAMEDSLLVGMRARDLAGRIVYVNPALCEMVGYRADELIGRVPPYPYWHPDDLDKHWRENNAALSGQAALTGFESRIRHRDGHDVHTMVYTAPLIDATGTHSGWMSSVVDITAQKRAEDQQRQQEAQLQHALRLASLGEMASTLAHELNQPMMALSNFASAAQAFAEQGEHTLLVASLGEITAQAQRSADIVRRVRGFVRQRTPGIEACAINDLVGNVLALLKPEIRSRQVRVVTHLQADLPTVPGDRVLLEQVLLNLLLNGLQALQETPSERRLVEIETAQVDGVVCLRVADQGPGVAPAAAAQLFEPFFTTKAGGLGLGLNICRTIIESHRGRLAFENRPGGGAVFSIQLRCVP